jgi:hypothetical protein
MAKRGFLQPWWLEVGTEICPVCHHMYPYETEYRCARCDGPVCSTCLEPTRKVCTPCSQSNDDAEDYIDIEFEV